MYFFVKISRSCLIFILVLSFCDVAAVLLFREKGNFREFVALPDEVMLEEVFVVAAVLPVVDEDDFRAFFGLTEDISETAVGSNPGVGKLRPASQMRPASSFSAKIIHFKNNKIKFFVIKTYI